MHNTQKKVIVRLLSGDLFSGYLPFARFLRKHGDMNFLDLLDLGGRIIPVPLADVKMVSYVRDFNLSDSTHPERLARRTFLARPRSEGLWVRLTFVGGDLLEGLAAADLSILTNVIDDAGLHMTPPDIRSNTQRIFVPRTAIIDLQLLAVITNPSRKKHSPSSEASPLQETLFDRSSPDATPS